MHSRPHSLAFPSYHALVPHCARLQVRDSMVAAARRQLEKRRQHEQRVTALHTSEQV